jgi:hypothetical protein
MASKKSTEQREKRGYLEADLRSLGIDPKKENELNDKQELQNLVDNIKGSMYQDYKTAYSRDGAQFEEEAKSTTGI